MAFGTFPVSCVGSPSLSLSFPFPGLASYLGLQLHLGLLSAGIPFLLPWLAALLQVSERAVPRFQTASPAHRYSLPRAVPFPYIFTWDSFPRDWHGVLWLEMGKVCSFF